jgi:hypothetical protein
MNDYEMIDYGLFATGNFSMEDRIKEMEMRSEIFKSKMMAEIEKARQPTKTLRDEYAMAALFGVNTKEFDPKEIASKAYAIADAMMEARK